MRIRIQLMPLSKQVSVPVNYQYPVSAAIYKILNQASPEYTEFLHDKGYAAPSGRLMKLFTFSKLHIPHARFEDGTLSGDSRQPWQLWVGSPMQEDFVENFVLGIFTSSTIEIVGQGTRSRFQVVQVESVQKPEFQEEMRFKCLSPIVISRPEDREHGRMPHYYRPFEEGLNEALRKNLLQKYQIIYDAPPQNESFEFQITEHDKPRSKKITIKEGTPEATELKAFETYFTLRGNPALMEVAWECGLGEHTSQGFGMVDVVGGKRKAKVTFSKKVTFGNRPTNLAREGSK
ncbi:MAG: CRISPR-associated endoribonuclease Cas6 [Calditrichaeota bacterium]|nr:CRISPR-associated endoribonuclease Cas6 [Calditrichota bacterium]